jgi:hypothetical protein
MHFEIVTGAHEIKIVLIISNENKTTFLMFSPFIMIFMPALQIRLPLHKSVSIVNKFPAGLVVMIILHITVVKKIFNGWIEMAENKKPMSYAFHLV